MPEHNLITDPYLHEPKGISTAAANKVYVADGAGSGGWKTAYINSVEDYNHDGGSQALSSGVWTKLLNDGLGPQTSTTYKIPGRAEIWDATSNQFKWADAGLQLGDSVGIRLYLTTTTSGANDNISLRITFGVGSGSPYSLELFDKTIKNAGAHNHTVYTDIYLGNTLTLNSPAEIEIRSDTGSDSIQVNGWYVKTNPRNPVYL